MQRLCKVEKIAVLGGMFERFISKILNTVSNEFIVLLKCGPDFLQKQNRHRLGLKSG